MINAFGLTFVGATAVLALFLIGDPRKEHCHVESGRVRTWETKHNTITYDYQSVPEGALIRYMDGGLYMWFKEVCE